MKRVLQVCQGCPKFQKLSGTMDVRCLCGTSLNNARVTIDHYVRLPVPVMFCGFVLEHAVLGQENSLNDWQNSEPGR